MKEHADELQKAIDILLPVFLSGGNAPDEPQGNETDLYYEAFGEGLENGLLGHAIQILQDLQK